MKQDTGEVVQRVVLISLGVFGSWSLQELSMWVAIASGSFASIYAAIQTIKILREWYLNEKDRRHRDKTN